MPWYHSAKARLLLGQIGAVEGRQDQVVAHRQRGAPPRRGGRNVGVDQIDESQLLGQGIEQGRGPKLPGLHGAERGMAPWGGSGVRWARMLLHDALPRTQIDLLDNARLALDAGGADPVEVRFAFFPFGNQAWHNGRVIHLPLYVQNYL